MAGRYGMAALSRLGLAVSAAALLVSCRCAAQAGGGGNGCMPELVSLSPCMGYMSGNGTTAEAPGAPCCSALSGMLLGSRPGCLCVVLGGNAANLGVAVDGDRVRRLPVACSVQTPTAGQCESAGASLPAPATPSDPNITGGSKAAPTAQYSGVNAGKAGKLPSTFIAIFGAILLSLRRC